MSTELTLFGFVLLGVFAHLIAKYQDSRTKKEVFDYKTQLIFSAIGLFFSLVIFLLRKELVSLTKGMVTMDMVMSKTYIFFAAYFIDSIWKNFINLGESRVNKKAIDNGNEGAAS